MFQKNHDNIIYIYIFPFCICGNFCLPPEVFSWKTETSTIHHLAVKGGCGCCFWLGMQQLCCCFPGNIPSQLLPTWRGPYCSISWAGKPPSIQENCKVYSCLRKVLMYTCMHHSPFHSPFPQLVALPFPQDISCNAPHNGEERYVGIGTTIVLPGVQITVFPRALPESKRSPTAISNACFVSSNFLWICQIITYKCISIDHSSFFWIPRFSVSHSGWGAGEVQHQNGPLCGQTRLQ